MTPEAHAKNGGNAHVMEWRNAHAKKGRHASTKGGRSVHAKKGRSTKARLEAHPKCARAQKDGGVSGKQPFMLSPRRAGKQCVCRLQPSPSPPVTSVSERLSAFFGYYGRILSPTQPLRRADTVAKRTRVTLNPVTHTCCSSCPTHQRPHEVTVVLAGGARMIHAESGTRTCSEACSVGPAVKASPVRSFGMVEQ